MTCYTTLASRPSTWAGERRRRRRRQGRGKPSPKRTPTLKCVNAHMPYNAEPAPFDFFLLPSPMRQDSATEEGSGGAESESMQVDGDKEATQRILNIMADFLEGDVRLYTHSIYMYIYTCTCSLVRMSLSCIPLLTLSYFPSPLHSSLPPSCFSSLPFFLPLSLSLLSSVHPLAAELPAARHRRYGHR